MHFGAIRQEGFSKFLHVDSYMVCGRFLSAALDLTGACELRTFWVCELRTALLLRQPIGFGPQCRGKWSLLDQD
jgi:hypothetical protein